MPRVKEASQDWRTFMRHHFTLIIAAFALLFATACGSSGSQADALSSALAAGGGHYVQRNLVSDGFVPAEHTDANLVNAWGITHLPTTPWWVSDNGANVATLYDGNGIAQFPPQPLVVGITGGQGGAGDPDGVVANATTHFVVSSGGASGPARFIFASEDGTISGWNPGVPPPIPPATRSTMTVVAVDNSSPDPLGGAVYKGIAIASTPAGDRLYATDFRGGRVEVFDGTFAPVAGPSFVDPGIPAGYAPFGIRTIGDTVYVTYALQDDAKHDDVAGKHHGFVSAFATDGTFLRRIASRGKLNSPWGLALAPVAGFGRFSGKLLVGNFGDGRIIGYSLDGSDDNADDEEGGGAFLTGKGGPITIDGLWGIDFGNDAAAGPANTLFFAAGPDHENHGLFGRIDFASGEPQPGSG
jgi:uncharacterized protein (TIGR03118 family)